MKQTAMALFAAGLGGVPSFIARAANNKKLWLPYKKNKILICIFQRGAMDGLMAVSPFTDVNLKQARPTLFMSPAQTEGASIDLDGQFALHPALQAFAPYFKENRLAIVHGVGSPNNTRSHFDAQDYMESGTPFSKSTPSGWLNRAVGALGHEGTPFRAVSLTSALPRIFYGDNETLAINNLQDFAIQMRGNPIAANKVAQSFEQLYDHTSSSLLNKTGKESFEAIKMLNANAIKTYQPTNGAIYPVTPLGNALKQIACLIKMDVGLEVGFAESGGWDTHFNQGTATGQLANNLRDFSNCINALWKDLGNNYQDDVTIMTMTEFGRTVKQNGTAGTDHGRASCLFVLGNDVNGGKVYNNMKSLAKENLEDGRDLPVTTDFRAVFESVAGNHLQIKNTKTLFPGWDGNKLSLMKT